MEITLSGAGLFIAAHAVSPGTILVSRGKAFQHLHRHITVEDWATDVIRPT